jgi:hypothetical protein
MSGRAMAVLVAVALGATAAAAQERIVELPPMIVMERPNLPPWQYVRTEYGEYLSRCTPATTREFVTADLRQFQLLRVFLPDSLLVKMDTPWVVVLDRTDLKPAGDTIMQDMVSLQQQRVSALREAEGPVPSAPLTGRIESLLNLRIDDRDMNGLFAYLDEKKYDGDHMVITGGYVRFQLERRVPDLPGWFVEGAVAVFEQSIFVQDPIVVRPFTWVSNKETTALLRNPEWPRALLPMNELFASDVLRGEGDRAPLRRDVFRSQVALFFRWAIDPRNGMRDGLWKLAERAGHEPVTENVFEECFGFGFAEMRDRLSDYLPIAVKEPLRLEAGKLERPRPGEVRAATKEQISRVLGEWERLEIAYVKARHAEFTDRYAQEARRTLRKAYDLGDRDPALLAAIGLCEIDAGNESGAPFFLNRAVTAGVVRPRAYYETARLLFSDLVRNLGPGGKLTASETEQVVAPLRTGLQQAPMLPEAAVLCATAWLRSAAIAPASDLALLVRATRNFPARPAVTYAVALLHARSGRPAVAQALLAETLRFPLDESLRARFAELQRSIANSAK